MMYDAGHGRLSLDGLARETSELLLVYPDDVLLAPRIARNVYGFLKYKNPALAQGLLQEFVQGAPGSRLADAAARILQQEQGAGQGGMR